MEHARLQVMPVMLRALTKRQRGRRKAKVVQNTEARRHAPTLNVWGEVAPMKRKVASMTSIPMAQLAAIAASAGAVKGKLASVPPPAVPGDAPGGGGSPRPVGSMSGTKRVSRAAAWGATWCTSWLAPACSRGHAEGGSCGVGAWGLEGEMERAPLSSDATTAHPALMRLQGLQECHRPPSPPHNGLT